MIYSNKKFTTVGCFVLFIGLILLTLLGYPIGMLGLGILLVSCSVWGFIFAESIWESYKKSYKKLPKKQQTIWNQPKEIYYAINHYIFIPLGFAVGSLLIYLYWLLR